MLDLLQLLQLADSALPIGASSHSFGIETLTAEGTLTPQNLDDFFANFAAETAPLEAFYSRKAYRLVASVPSDVSPDVMFDFGSKWIALNQQLSARKVARESRDASTTLGRRFLRLVATVHPDPLFQNALHDWRGMEKAIHHSTAFGLVGGKLGFDEDAVVGAYLQQSLTGLLSACQRLMSVGQMQALTLTWQLKPQIVRIVDESRMMVDDGDVYSFAPLLDLAGMRHANLPVRLFIS